MNSACESKTMLTYFTLIMGPRENLDLEQGLSFAGLGEKQTERVFLT